MAGHECFGIVPLRKEKGRWQVFLIHRTKGFWEFPKGHAEEGETPVESAKRELFEETGLQVNSFLSETPLQISYPVKNQQKTVYYYLAEVDGIITLQEEEVLDGKWLLLEESAERLTFKNSKDLVPRILEQITN